MKLKTLLIVCLLLAGCGTQTEVEAPKTTSTADLLNTSDSVIANAERSSQILDSVTTVTTEKVHDNIKVLTNTITNYETKIKTTNATKTITVEKIIHDTVYIETKKSFWGKTKISVAKSTTSIDSASNLIEQEPILMGSISEKHLVKIKTLLISFYWETKVLFLN